MQQPLRNQAFTADARPWQRSSLRATLSFGQREAASQRCNHVPRLDLAVVPTLVHLAKSANLLVPGPIPAELPRCETTFSSDLCRAVTLRRC